jgi:hypothetical protein
MDELLAELGDPGLEQLAGMLGTDLDTARSAIRAAGGIIVAGLARGAEHPEGAEALRCALDEHVDTDPFNSDVASLTRDGRHILAYVLGGQGVEYAAEGLARLTDLDVGALMKVLPLLAPMIMSLLAGREGMDAGSMAADLRRERSAGPEPIGGILQGLFDDPLAPAAGQEGAGDR